MALRPTTAERSGLRFLIGGSRWFGLRYLLALGLFVIGWAVCCMEPVEQCVAIGCLVMVAGHLPIWVRRQSLAPGGATPEHGDVWAPVDEDWYETLVELEKKGRRWDLSPWDLSSALGFSVLFLFAMGIGTIALVVVGAFGEEAAVRFLAASAALWLPLWLNGMRSNWNPSELGLKGGVLRRAARAVQGPRFAGRYEAVPMLALVETSRGKAPVDARLMLRPTEDDGSGLMGVQVQVCLNNVRGRDYPYAYCVVLAKPGFHFPRLDTPLTLERGGGDGVTYLVVRQHADRQGGWHTDSQAVLRIVHMALRFAEQGRRDNR